MENNKVESASSSSNSKTSSGHQEQQPTAKSGPVTFPTSPAMAEGQRVTQLATAKKETNTPQIQPSANSKQPVGGSVQGDWISEIRGQAEGMDQSIRSFVAKSPIAAVAIAVGVGFAGSLLLGKLKKEVT